VVAESSTTRTRLGSRSLMQRLICHAFAILRRSECRQDPHGDEIVAHAQR